MNIEEWSSQTKKDEVGVIAIDFDNVIHNNGKGFYDGTCYGKPIDGAIESIKKISKKFRIVIYSFKGHPERPLITINLSFGISREIFFKLCSFAPFITIFLSIFFDNYI